MEKTFTKSELNEFLSMYPLYKKYRIGQYERGGEGYCDPAFLNEEVYSRYCPKEDKIAQFELEIPYPQSDYWNRQWEEGVNPLVLNAENRLDYVMHYKGNCMSCNKCTVDVILHVWTDKPIPKEYDNTLIYDEKSNKHIFVDNSEHVSVYIEKVGEYPVSSEHIDKKVLNFLFVNNRDLYIKAQQSISQNMGLAALMYLKQVVESEIVLLTNDIARIDPVYEELIYEQLDKYKSENDFHYISKFLIEHLPKNLDTGSSNHLNLLSELINISCETVPEEEALEIAMAIDLNLKYIIHIMYEENHPVVDARLQQVIV